MSTSTSKVARFLATSILLASTLALAACGGGPQDCSVEPGDVPAQVQATGRCPVSSVTAIDGTSVTGDRELARGYVAAAMRAVEPTATQGGRLRLVVFGNNANQTVTLLDEAVPALSEEGAEVRGAREAALREKVRLSLSVALGLVPAERLNAAGRSLRIRVRGNTARQGSDIARALRNGARSLGDRDPSVLTVITDGLLNSGSIDLSTSRGLKGVSDAAERIGTRTGRLAGPSLVQLVGLGTMSERYRENQSAERSDALVRIWTQACQRAEARRCRTSTEV